MFSLTAIGAGFTTFERMILKFIIWSIVLTLIVRFILRFVLPFFHMANVAQSRMKEMRDQMEKMQHKANEPAASQVPPKKVDGEYIEYEEVK